MITDFSQCDEAMQKVLSGLVINERKVPVIYIDPEKEFKTSELPTIAFYRNGIYPDNFRWSNDLLYDNMTFNLDGSPKTVDERLAPIPYNIYYGIRIYYEYQRDGAKLNTHIHSVLKRGAYVEVGGDLYDITFVSYRNPEATYKEYGEQKENKRREFVEQYLYKLEMELDLAPRVTKDISTELVFKTDIQP